MRLYAHGVDPFKWADRWGIEPLRAACQDCGEINATALPFVDGAYRGLAIDCACGSRVPYCLVAATGDLLGTVLP